MSTPSQTGNGKRLLILTLVVLLATAAWLVIPRTTQITIVAFGDSTTDTRETIDQVYTDRLPALLAPHGIEATVINAGMGGSHTGHLKDNDAFKVPHARDRFRSAVMAFKPDLVIMQFGANDGWVDVEDSAGASRIPIDDYTANLSYLMKKFTEDGSRIILMTPNKIGSPFPAWRNERMRQYAEAVKALAEETHTPIIDLWVLPDEQVDDHLLDGQHPNDRGHAFVAGLLAERIPAVLK